MSTVLWAAAAAGLLIALLRWHQYGWWRGVVAVLYWLANRLLALAAAADHARLIYNERLAPGSIEMPMPEEEIRAARSGRLLDLTKVGER